jgi:hypothetical protein
MKAQRNARVIAGIRERVDRAAASYVKPDETYGPDYTPKEWKQSLGTITGGEYLDTVEQFGGDYDAFQSVDGAARKVAGNDIADELMRRAMEEYWNV